jgi:Acyl-CoA carboxylase epsilon subunit
MAATGNSESVNAGSGASADASFDRSQITFVTRGVSDAEVAAVTAVLRGLLQEESDHLRRSPDRVRSAWDVGQRAIRSPLEPGAGRWRSFSG